MKFGVVYRHPSIYNLLLYMLYKGNPQERFTEVANEVPEGSTILDLCAGTDLMFRSLKDRASHYQAIDINPVLVKMLRRKGISAEVADVLKTPLPHAAVVMMNSSLYHFGPDVGALLLRMRQAARKKVIILEPIANNADSKVSLFARFSRWASKVDGVAPLFHFTRDTFQSQVTSQPGLLRWKILDNGRDALAIFEPV